MKKILKLMIAIFTMGLLILTLSGFTYSNLELNFDENNFLPKIELEKGCNYDLLGWDNTDEIIEYDGEDFSYSYSYSCECDLNYLTKIDKGSKNYKRAIDGFMNLDPTINTNLQIGTMDLKRPKDKNTIRYNKDENGKNVCDVVFEATINSGLTFADLYEKNFFNMNTYPGAKDAYNRYKKGSASEKKAIEEEWENKVIVTLNFAAPIAVTKGDKYVELSSNNKSAVVHLGKAMRDNGADIQLISSVTNKNGHVASTVDGKEPTIFEKYSDLDPNAWYAPAVEYALKNNIIVGNGNGICAPNDNVTFAELAMMMNTPSVAYVPNYAIIDYELIDLNHWGGERTGKAISVGYMMKEDLSKGAITEKDLDKKMTREQAIYALTKLSEYRNSEIKVENPSIPDLSSINSKYREMIKQGYRVGLTKGMDSTGTFAPKNYITRAEVAQIFYNMKW